MIGVGKMKQYANVLDRPIGKGKQEVSLSAFAFLFSELVQYNQTQVDNIAELERRLEDAGIVVGVRILELLCHREKIGCGQKKEKHLRKPEVGHFRAQGVPMKRKLREFPVTEDALLPVETSIDVRHFVPGQYVDVTGITKGWGFKGMPASHGASLSHRSIGSTGQSDAPGKVFKGKKMPGHMGVEQRTVKNVWIYKIDPARNLLWVRGQVPCATGNLFS